MTELVITHTYELKFNEQEISALTRLVFSATPEDMMEENIRDWFLTSSLTTALHMKKSVSDTEWFRQQQERAAENREFNERQEPAISTFEHQIPNV